MADDDTVDRDAILRRRHRFIALALSGLTSAIVPGCEDAGPAPTAPRTCLDAPIAMAAIEEDDASEPPEADAGPPDAGAPEAATAESSGRRGPKPPVQTGHRAPPRQPSPRVCLWLKPGEPDDDPEGAAHF